ncbi:MAG: indole-3-glycerol phosphate synthase TrpC, partial [Thermoleophilaceae bacterium]
MNPRLEGLVEATRRACDRRRETTPLEQVREAALSEHHDARPFAEALARPGTSLIAEHKRRSPSAGRIRDGAGCAEIVGAYGRGGAAALSIVTEEAHFGGSLADLREARATSDLPILRKDFTVDPYMLFEAKAAGADAVLLVVGSLREADLHELYRLARSLDLDAMVEISRRDELDTALRVDADVIGINNRDLEDFTVDITRTFDLLADV